ncbi:DNA cytosine methyltransferase [Maridesulfovibrio sp.]|uniref:DNA cytosine methyltransferase n=1 Tax=Maridesulfovibrio sp. TaxID=2795000 RepID=UPI003AFFBFF4
MRNPSKEIKHFHLFCGIGGGAIGFNKARADVGTLTARFRCLGGVDCEPSVIKDFNRHVGVSGTVLDLFDREQYRDFHGEEAPADWKEATTDDIRKAAGGERPNIVFTSAPCKGFSGLLSTKKSTSKKYQALNRLTLRGVWLTLEAWQDDPPEFILFENVPRIASRGRDLLDQITGLLRTYGYAVAETTHDCGELAGLSQSRKRFLLVARHAGKVPPFLYEPLKKPLGTVGAVLEKLPMPGCCDNPMHSLPRLQWKTWLRLAFVKAGSDWRSLKELAVEDGFLRDYGVVPDWDCRKQCYGVLPWNSSSGTITGQAEVSRGRFSIADPREVNAYTGIMGVKDWNETSATITSKGRATTGPYSVADPRMPDGRYKNVFRVINYGESSATITSGGGPSAGGLSVSDPRLPDKANRHYNFYRIVEWNKHSRTVTGATNVSGGAPCVADPRPGINKKKGSNFLTAGHYGVVPWNSHCGAVIASARYDKGIGSVADIRMPKPNENMSCVIRALDGTWHRPFTTYELAALQGFVDPDQDFSLCGESHQSWRERIGNAVPPPAAQAIAEVMGQTLLLAWSGETFAMSSLPIWVQPFVGGMMVEVANE